jgi:hypothetical protein
MLSESTPFILQFTRSQLFIHIQGWCKQGNKQGKMCLLFCIDQSFSQITGSSRYITVESEPMLASTSKTKNVFLVNKTNRCTEFKFYWYYYSTCFRQPFCPSSGVLTRTSALIYFMQLWRLRTPDDGQKCCPKHVE